MDLVVQSTAVVGLQHFMRVGKTTDPSLNAHRHHCSMAACLAEFLSSKWGRRPLTAKISKAAEKKRKAPPKVGAAFFEPNK